MNTFAALLTVIVRDCRMDERARVERDDERSDERDERT